MKTATSAVRVKIARLGQIAVDLQEGKSFSVTRLTTIKSLCTDHAAARSFAVHIARLAKRKMDARDRPDFIKPKEWVRFKEVVSRSVLGLERAEKEGIEESRSQLQESLRELEKLQNTYEHQEWGPVRIMRSREALVVEYAVNCFLSKSQAPYWAYLMARTYAERFDAGFFGGLVPKSAPMVEEIATFWRNYYLTAAEAEPETK